MNVAISLCIMEFSDCFHIKKGSWWYLRMRTPRIFSHHQDYWKFWSFGDSNPQWYHDVETCWTLIKLKTFLNYTKVKIHLNPIWFCVKGWIWSKLLQYRINILVLPGRVHQRQDTSAARSLQDAWVGTMLDTTMMTPPVTWQSEKRWETCNVATQQNPNPNLSTSHPADNKGHV